MKRYAAYKPSGVAWLGDVPAHWKIKKVKFLAELVGDKTDLPNSELQYIGLEHVESKTGRFVESTEGMQTEAESTVNQFSKGCVLFGKLRPYLAKAVVTECDGLCSSEFLVFKPLSMNAEYLKRSMLLDGFIKTIDASTFGAKMPRADWTFISQLNLPQPPITEQQAIADYLDVETTRIDGLIEAKRDLINLLGEYRQSVISDAVLKGLNPDAPLKPSGVAWLGDVPAHWEVKRMRFMTKANPKPSMDLNDIASVSFLPMEAIGDDGALQLEQIRNIDEVSSGYTFFENGDVTIAKITPCFENGKGAHMQGLHNEVGFGTTELIVIRPLEQVDSNYLYLLTQTHLFRKTGEATMLGAGGQKRVSDGFVKDFAIAWPSLDEQQTIAGSLETQITRFDALIAHAETEIDLLKELRAAAIADAVLGRVDVRIDVAA